ncbi:MAG: queuosine precursor transporter [Nanoarchaeota archaeon]|nr:queuosine precursor transporter [Nanoarchaeota archaeon]MBU1005382.1 queuosine precursor transporter [Nanoarchaeota archaeon]MBU1945571.1 queuosine precursor transporter [Nanoarchaeota archaeon]
MKWDLEFKTNLLLGLFVASLVAANLLGGKITKLGFIEVSVGIFAYPVTFLITDMICEVHGKQKTKSFVWVGFISMLFILLITILSVWLPFAPRSYVQSEQYNPVFGISLRFFIASITAFLLSQFHDVWAFNFWKEKTKGKFLWLRNNASTIVSQFIDTVVFMFIALYYIPGLPQLLNTSPKFTTAYLFTLIIPYYLLKVVVALLDTPLVYAGVWWLKKK